MSPEWVEAFNLLSRRTADGVELSGWSMMALSALGGFGPIRPSGDKKLNSVEQLARLSLHQFTTRSVVIAFGVDHGEEGETAFAVAVASESQIGGGGGDGSGLCGDLVLIVVQSLEEVGHLAEGPKDRHLVGRQRGPLRASIVSCRWARRRPPSKIGWANPRPRIVARGGGS